MNEKRKGNLTAGTGQARPQLAAQGRVFVRVWVRVRVCVWAPRAVTAAGMAGPRGGLWPRGDFGHPRVSVSSVANLPGPAARWQPQAASIQVTWPSEAQAPNAERG
jgi:hypothetical protein